MTTTQAGVRCGDCLSETFKLTVTVTDDAVDETVISCSECGRSFGDFNVTFETETAN